MTDKDNNNFLVDDSMLELFRLETDQQTAALTDGLLKLEERPGTAEHLEPLMRAAHSIKGAARLVGLPDAVELAHAMEDCLVAAQRGKLSLLPEHVDLLLKAVDILRAISDATKEGVGQSDTYPGERAELVAAMKSVLDGKPVEAAPMQPSATPSPEPKRKKSKKKSKAPAKAAKNGSQPAKPTASKSQSVVVAPVNGEAIDSTMLELFRMEVEQHGQVLTDGLLSLEAEPDSSERVESLMRAAHSIKGAARLVGVQAAVSLAHRMEDCLVAAQKGELNLSPDGIDVLLKSNDMLASIAALTDEPKGAFSTEQEQHYVALLQALDDVLAGKPMSERLQPPSENSTQSEHDEGPSTASETARKIAEDSSGAALPADQSEAPAPTPDNNSLPITKDTAAPAKPKSGNAPPTDRVLRIRAEQLNRLMGLAGESMVEARWLRPYAESMLRLKRRQADLITFLDVLREALDDGVDRDKVHRLTREAQGKAEECRQILSDRLADLESYDRRAANLSSRLRREVVASRMRPFGDGVQGFPRMVRDVARSLGKQVHLLVEGQATLVDRDILEKIEAPLNHLLRNAVDHGAEMPADRIQEGKPERVTIRLSAYHQSGMLSVVVEDDGRGVDLNKLRRKVVERGLVNQDMADNLSETELMEFLFLPSFSTKEQVSEISGRGVGLDVVHDVVQEMRGMVRATSQLGKGTRFQLQLPLTLSVIPALLVEICGEPYAFPLARIERILHVNREALHEVEGHQYISVEDHHIGLVSAHQVLGFNESADQKDMLPVVVLGERKNSYGLVVDRFLGERDLVVHVMPSQLGKVKDISAAALMENGAPLLIVDVDDMLRSIEKIVSVGRLSRVGRDAQEQEQTLHKRILVVDDSITVREVERKLLETCGYEVEVAVDGMDGWNALRERKYDLVITDIDMPRMDGIELVRMIRQEDSYRSLPIMIVSYKDREEDRVRGLDAGADYYLTKGSFHDQTLRDAVIDLIGAAA